MSETGLSDLSQAAVRAAFDDVGRRSSALKSLGATGHIERGDVVDVLSDALGRELSISELAVVVASFAMDAGATMGWDEFKAGLERAREAMGSGPLRAPKPALKSHKKLMEFRRKGRNVGPGSTVPLTSSQARRAAKKSF